MCIAEITADVPDQSGVRLVGLDPVRTALLLGRVLLGDLDDLLDTLEWELIPRVLADEVPALGFESSSKTIRNGHDTSYTSQETGERASSG